MTLPDTYARRFWLGPEGASYLERNRPTRANVTPCIQMLNRAVPNDLRADPFAMILEVGIGPGITLRAMRVLCAGQLYGVDLQRAAVERSSGIARTSIGDATSLPHRGSRFHLTYTWGLLMLLPPGEEVGKAYDELARVTRPDGYVLMCEYFAPEAEAHTYRGFDGVLWRRDAGKEFWERHPDWTPDGYGFFWEPIDGASINWWRFKKPGPCDEGEVLP